MLAVFLRGDGDNGSGEEADGWGGDLMHLGEGDRAGG